MKLRRNARKPETSGIGRGGGSNGTRSGSLGIGAIELAPKSRRGNGHCASARRRHYMSTCRAPPALRRHLSFSRMGRRRGFELAFDLGHELMLAALFAISL